uniref:Zf-CCHC domain-containing protein/UBN2 domain-containing protein n=1 Tax=Tanacetum cinerariifolium TaxID=118510 RepID=A0A6L2JGM5_TANCI|nr:zf-CCHC domain-containing protein/UBN2 domain-containing protein [Tanacetum cinerariifolium]
MSSLRERMEHDLEARIMGETLVLNRSLDPFFEDYIELNDFNVPLELRRYQVDDLIPTIEEDFAVLEYMDAYRDEGMGDVIFGEPFLREVRINARWFEGMITIYNGNEEVIYQMVRSDPRVSISFVVGVVGEEEPNDLKKKLAKNNEAKMVFYNALPKNEYERIFMCKTAKDIWQSLLITHQGNSQVKDNKIDLLAQQYEHFTILKEESIDSGFARFNTIITSLKALDEGLSSKNYVRKFLMDLHPKWREKVTVIEESKDLSSLALDELIGNLKKESSDDKTLTSESDDEEYAMVVRNFKKFFRRKGKFVRQPKEEKKSFRQRDEKKGESDKKCFRCGDPNHHVGDYPKPSCNKDQKAFIGGSWSDSKNDAKDKTNAETCLMAQSSNDVTLNSSHYSDDASSLDNDSLGFDSDKTSTSGTKTMSFIRLPAEKGIDGSTIKVHGSTLPGILSRNYGEKGTKHIFSPPMCSRSDFVITRKKIIHNSIDESKEPSLRPSPESGIDYLTNVTFDQSSPPTKFSPLVDDDVGEEEAIRKNTKIVNTNNEEDESIEVDEIVNIKESKNHPLDQVIGNINQRTLRSQDQNRSNFFCFISTMEPKNVNEALKDKSWVVAMQDELN